MGIPGRLACPRCHEGGDLTAPPEVCGSCGTVMEIEPDLRLVKPNLAEKIRRRPRGLWRWQEFLPGGPSPAVTLGEGDTPLLLPPRLAQAVGIEGFWIKKTTARPPRSAKGRWGSGCAPT